MKRLIIQMSLKAREVFNFDEGAARAVAEKLGDGKGTVFDTPGIPSFYASCSEAKNYTLLVIMLPHEESQGLAYNKEYQERIFGKPDPIVFG
jgi:precorrin-2 methylase